MSSKLPFGATVGDTYQVFHEGNHNNEFNPHPQYYPADKIVIVTQAQYNALPANKNSDDKLYFIKA